MAKPRARSGISWPQVALTASGSNLRPKGQSGLSDKSWLFRENYKHGHALELRDLDNRAKIQEKLEIAAQKKMFKRQDLIYNHNKAFANRITNRVIKNRDTHMEFYGNLDNFSIAPADFWHMRHPETIQIRDKMFPTTATKKGRNDPLQRLGRVPVGWKWASAFSKAPNVMNDVTDRMGFESEAFKLVKKAQIVAANGDMTKLTEISELHAAGISLKRDPKTNDITAVIGADMQEAADSYERILKKVGPARATTSVLRNFYRHLIIQENSNIENNQERKNTSKRLVNDTATKLIKQTTTKTDGFIAKADFKALPTIADATGKRFNFTEPQIKMQGTIFRIAKSISEEPQNKKYGTLRRPQLAALLATAYAESSFNEKNEGDKNFSKGLYQINTSPNVKHNLTSEEKANLFDPETNIRLVLEKINGGGALKNKAFMNAKTVKEATNILVRDIIKPKKLKEAQKKYSAYAKQFFNNFGIQEAPVEDKRSDGKLLGDNMLTFLRNTKKVGDIKKWLQGTSVPEWQDMIGKSEEKAGELNKSLVEKVVQAARSMPEYATLLDNKNLSQWGKAKTILEQRRRRITKNTESKNALDANKITTEQEAKGIYDIGATIAGLKGKHVRKINLNVVQLAKDLKSLEQDKTRQGGEQDRKLTGPQASTLKVRAWESYIRDIERSHGKEVAMQIMTHTKWGGMIFSAIQGSVGPGIAFSMYTTANPPPERYPLLSRLFGKDLKTAFDKRAKILNNAEEDIVFEIGETTEINSLGVPVKIPTYTPSGTVNTDVTKDNLIYTKPSYPNKDNYSHTEASPLLYQSATVQKFSKDSRIALGTNTIAAIANGDMKDPNERLQRLKNIVQKYFVQGVKKAGDADKKPFLVKQYFEDLLKDPEFKNETMLFGSDLIESVAYNMYHDVLQKEYTKDHVMTPDESGVAPIVGRRLLKEARPLSMEKYSSLPIMKEALRSEAFLVNAGNIARGMMQDFGTMGAVLIDSGTINLSGMSDTISKIYTNFKNKMDLPEGKKTAQAILELARGISVKEGYTPEQVRDAELLLRAFRSTGAERASDVGFKVDSWMAMLGSLRTTAKSLINTTTGQVLDGFLKTFFGEEQKVLEGIKRKDFDFLSDAETQKQDNALSINMRPDRKVYAHQDMQSFTGYLKGKSKSEIAGNLRRFQEDAEKKLTGILKDSSKNKRQKELAILSAKRTFNAIAITYQFAGMLQGGSGGRAISNEDFENLYKALWAGGGSLQASNIEHALGIISDVQQRFKIVKALSKRGEAVSNMVIDHIRSLQSGRRLFLDSQNLKRQAKVYGTNVDLIKEKYDPYSKFPPATGNVHAGNEYTNTIAQTLFHDVVAAVDQTGESVWTRKGTSSLMNNMNLQKPHKYLEETHPTSDEYSTSLLPTNTERMINYARKLQYSDDPRDMKWYATFGLEISEKGPKHAADFIAGSLQYFMWSKFMYGMRKLDNTKLLHFSGGAALDSQIKTYLKSNKFKEIKSEWKKVAIKGGAEGASMQGMIDAFEKNVEENANKNNITLSSLTFLYRLMPNSVTPYMVKVFQEQIKRFGQRHIAESRQN